jgi:AAA+ ATPase superfamily predicted ATPase
MFVGRKNELKLLNDAYRSEKDELVVLYGRRRIGKSSLVKRFAEKKKPIMNLKPWRVKLPMGRLIIFYSN